MESTDIESTNETEPGAPVRLVTVNQIVAWNIAWLRHEAGMTQQDLAELLGWPQNKVSEAERSWNGKRTREFDAQTLIALAMALDVPVSAFFLPPLDDGQAAVYVIRPPGQAKERSMADLISFAITDTDGDSGVMHAYRRRLVTSVGKYLGPEWMKEVARWLRQTLGLEALREGAYRMRAFGVSLRTEANWADAWADAIGEVIGEEEE